MSVSPLGITSLSTRPQLFYLVVLSCTKVKSRVVNGTVARSSFRTLFRSFATAKLRERELPQWEDFLSAYLRTEKDHGSEDVSSLTRNERMSASKPESANNDSLLNTQRTSTTNDDFEIGLGSCGAEVHSYCLTLRHDRQYASFYL